MLKNHTRRYLDSLQTIVNSYNKTRQTSLLELRLRNENENESRLQQYLLRTSHSKSKIKMKKFKFKIGQTVQISHVRSVFDRIFPEVDE